MLEKLKTIQGKQLLLAMIVSLVPLLVVGILVTVISIEQIRDDVRNELRQIIRDKAQAIEMWLNERMADVTLLASSNYVKEILSDGDTEDNRREFHDFFVDFADQYGVYETAILLDNKGSTIETFNYIPGFSTDFPSPPKEKGLGSRVSDVFMMDGKAHFFISAAVSDGYEDLGQLVVVTSMADLNEITDNIRVGRTGEVYMVNKEGYFITHKDRRRVLSDNIANVEPIAKLISGKQELFVGEFTDYRNIPVLGAYYYIDHFRWGLVAEQDVEEAFAPAVRLAQTMVLVILLSSLLVAVIAYLLTSSTLSPLSTLQQTIEKIADGDLDVRFPVRRRDEIGVTGEVFNKMLEQLQAVQQQLEKKVEASDRKLIKAYQELQIRHDELKQAQDRLLRTERLSVMGEIAAGLAHEINNPLTTIKMLIDSLDSLDEEEPEERIKALEVISEEIDKVAAMLGRFMDLTHPQEIRREPVVIEKVIDRTLALMRPKLDKGNIKVSVDVQRDIPKIIGDERQLGQLLLNLLLNSLNAMPDGGSISISATRKMGEEIGGLPGSFLRLEVRDKGAGIAPEEIDKIFNPFFTTRADGTGLGLPIAARIAESHGGQIGVRSEMGKGTTFFIDIPESKE